MNLKRLILLALAIAIGFWLMQRNGHSPEQTPEKPINLMEGQQKQMQKARDVGKELQNSLEKRMQGSEH